MQVSWNITSLTGSSDPLQVDGLPWPVELRMHPRARSVRLRLNERGGRLVLTYPKRMSRKTAIDWARKQTDWAVAQISKIAPRRHIEPGQVIPVRGVDLMLVWEEKASRRPTIDGRRLVAGGPVESFAGRIERFLRAMARDQLSERTKGIAEIAGVAIRSVSVGDAVSRWGSCSASGAIRYNWRLILAPPHILDWVVAHEVAHRVHMNHGPEFRRLEASLYDGDVAAARAELRLLGPGLKRIGLPV